MDTKPSTTLTAILTNDLKGSGGLEPLILASRYKGSGKISQAYRDLFAARIRQHRLRFHLPESDHLYDDRYAALERKAMASLNTIRDSSVVG